MGNWIDLIFKRYSHLYFLTILKIDVTHVSLEEYTFKRLMVTHILFSLIINIPVPSIDTSWFRTQSTNEGHNAFRNANTIVMAKCTMLSDDKLLVKVIALMVGEHRNTEGMNFPKQSLLI